MKRTVVLLFAVAITAGIWCLAYLLPTTAIGRIAAAIAGILIIIPVVIVGRRLLDHRPTIEQAENVTTWIHFLVSICLGASILEAFRFGHDFDPKTIPIPSWLGLSLMFASSLALLLVVLNLALKGMGAPMAYAITRRIATEWFYAWTRNPLVFCGVVLLIGIGLWLQSGLFLAWVLFILLPGTFFFLKMYEERELEIRFGQAYLDYKARTPGFWPKKPRQN